MRKLSIDTFSPEGWKDYELIDTGGGEKLERFGEVILARSEPQAIWGKSLSEKEWQNLAHSRFSFDKFQKAENKSIIDKGQWKSKNAVPQNWNIQYAHKELTLNFNLSLTAFKHVGLFPEQANNWQFIYQAIKKLKQPQPKVLNLFAYTGGASLAAKTAGADTTHVDSIKQVVSWAKRNMESSGLKDIRWVVEDAKRFMQREAKRGNKYQGIMLDPPAYGRGPKGEKWILEDEINEMMRLCSEILSPDGFLVLNLYSMGFSSVIAHHLIAEHFDISKKTVESGEVIMPCSKGLNLPLGTVARFY